MNSGQPNQLKKVSFAAHSNFKNKNQNQNENHINFYRRRVS
jgi:hypothetical protein